MYTALENITKEGGSSRNEFKVSEEQGGEGNAGGKFRQEEVLQCNLGGSVSNGEKYMCICI